MWSNKKYPKRQYTSFYTRTTKGADRVFVLCWINPDQEANVKSHTITFESYQQANKTGWIKNAVR